MFPSALRCISLVQPAHIPSCCPFQNMAGEGKEERERGSQSTRLMPVDHTSSKREARQAWPHLVESAQNAWGPGNVEVEETGANSQAFFPPPPSRAAGPWPSHTSIFSFIVHAVAGVPLQFQPSGAVLSAHLWVPWAMQSHHLSCCGLVISECWSQDWPKQVT